MYNYQGYRIQKLELEFQKWLGLDFQKCRLDQTKQPTSEEAALPSGGKVHPKDGETKLQ